MVPRGFRNVRLAWELPSSTPTVSEALAEATRVLCAARVPEAELSAEHLIAAAVGGPDGSGDRSRTISIHRHRCLTPAERGLFEGMVAQRLERMPVQMILGSWDFHDITLRVAPGVLCPRPETELLVDLALAAMPRRPSPKVLDIGAGTGALGLALLNSHLTATCDAIDIDPSAVALATQNAHDLDLADRYKCHQASVATFSESRARRDAEPYDMLVSNPPYIPTGVQGTLSPEVERYEASTALFAGSDGLDVITQIVAGASTLANSTAPILLEVDVSHAKRVAQMLEALDSTRITRVELDLQGQPRFVIAQPTFD